MLDAHAAVIADISPESAEYSRRLMENRGYRIAYMSDDGARAVAKCISERASLLLIDAVIPSLDGAAAAVRLRKMRLTRYPAVIIAAYPGLAVPVKPGMPGVCVVEKPLAAESLDAAIARTAPENRPMPGDIANRLSSILERLGVPIHPGRDYLMDAAFLAHEDRALASALTSELYPMVAKRAGTAPTVVERAMRHVIESAWMGGSIDEQYAVFKGTIDAARGKPTCGGMIAQLSEMLRMEDEQ